MTRRIGIVGASGYTGFELIRILAAHPGVELAALHSTSMAGRPVRDLYPDFGGDHRFEEVGVEELNRRGLDLVFLAMPDGYARATAPRLAARVIDLSRDFRADADVVYGLPEFHRDAIRGARLVANPGCYVTSCLLAARPLARAGLLRHAIFDAKSGWSGAGRTPGYANDPKNHADNLIPYKLTQHPHVKELRRFLEGTRVSFTPHVLPSFRGILTTAHFLLERPDEGAARARAALAEAYAGERFVRLLDRVPELRDSRGTNLCCLGGFEADDTGRLVVVSTIDNLLKGASGQAVQNMNLMLGLDEGAGLDGLDPRQANWRVIGD